MLPLADCAWPGQTVLVEGLDALGRFFIIVLQREPTVLDFLFSFLHIKPLLKKGPGSKFFPFGVDSFFGGKQNSSDNVNYSEKSIEVP